ncbi:MAG: hypothetical protein WCK26_01970 [Candidatus Saccharibacteria bacterium]
MDNKNYKSEKLDGVDVQKTERLKWRSRYDRLVTELGRLGTEVSVKRTLETSTEIDSQKFVVNALHKFIFPPQQIEFSQDNSTVHHTTPDHYIHEEDKTYDYDRNLVNGRILVGYDDSSNFIDFSVNNVRDERGKSELPYEVENAVKAAFSTESDSESV